MDKKNMVIVLGLVILVLIWGSLFFVLRRPILVSPQFGTSSELDSQVTLMTWEDPAGFKFSYPRDVNLDSHEEDEESYANLELTSPGREGRIIVWAKETDYTDIDTWVEENAASGQVFETQLGDYSARKIAFDQPRKISVAAIDVNALVVVGMEPDGQGFWQAVFDKILTTFEFIPIEGEAEYAVQPVDTSESVAGGGPVIIEEPEEVIE